MTDLYRSAPSKRRGASHDRSAGASPFDLATERRIVIIADWLPPDFGAVGQYMQMRAEHLAEHGHEVTLVGLASAGRLGAGATSTRAA